MPLPARYRTSVIRTLDIPFLSAYQERMSFLSIATAILAA